MYISVYKKNINFLSNIYFKIWSILLAPNHEHLHDKTIDYFFHQLV